MRMIAAAAAEQGVNQQEYFPHQAGHFTQDSNMGADTDAEQLHLDRQMAKQKAIPRLQS